MKLCTKCGKPVGNASVLDPDTKLCVGCLIKKTKMDKLRDRLRKDK